MKWNRVKKAAAVMTVKHQIAAEHPLTPAHSPVLTFQIHDPRAASSLLQSAYALLPATHLPATCYLLPTYPLPATCYLLPTYPLPATGYLLPATCYLFTRHTFLTSLFYLPSSAYPLCLPSSAYTLLPTLLCLLSSTRHLFYSLPF